MKEFYLQNKKIILSVIALFFLCTALILLYLPFEANVRVDVSGAVSYYGEPYTEEEYTLRKNYFDYCSFMDGADYGSASTIFINFLYASIAFSLAYVVMQVLIALGKMKEFALFKFAPMVLAILSLTTAVLFILYQDDSTIWHSFALEEIQLALFRSRAIQPNYNFIPSAILCLISFFIDAAVFMIPFFSKKTVSEKAQSEASKPAEASAPAPGADEADQIKKYKELLDSGAITQEEYDAKKKQLLGL